MSWGLTRVMEAVSKLLGSLGTVKVAGVAALLVLIAGRHVRHLLAGWVSLEVTLLGLDLSILVRRPRPFRASRSP